MILSDLSGNEFVNGFERYFTGYNLDNNHKIALIHLSLNFLLTSLNFLNFPFQKSSLQFCVKGLSGDAEHFGGEFDLVTYVPVSKKRKQERGYDQSYLLARETCRHWSVAPETLLQKTKDNVAQSSLSSREERQKNVVGAYVAVNEDKIKGQRILLIDDILTTGATLREAARVLREAGAERVICATLAAADED